MIKSISIFFPLYNDSRTVAELVAKAAAVVSGLDYEILLVNDGSEDNTLSVCRDLAKKNKRIRIINHVKNRGYGGALMSGFSAARKDWVFYTDGDAQYEVSELKKLISSAGKYDVVQGYKEKRNDRAYRLILGKTYLFLARKVYGVKAADPTCDFRLIRQKVAKKIRLTSKSGFVCVELVRGMERQKGIRIKEIEVKHYKRKYGRSQALRPKALFSHIFDFIRYIGRV